MTSVRDIKKAAQEGLKSNGNLFTASCSLFAGTVLQSVIITMLFLGFANWFAFIVAAILFFGIEGAFEYGRAVVTLSAAGGERVEFTSGFSGFNNFGSSLWACFLQRFYLLLWSLLIIPGIIKFYSYSMTYYILYDRPYIFGGQEAVTLSRKMMNGYKGKLFLLDLSFLGWFVLSALSFGVLWVVYVNSYYNTARACFFRQLQQEYDKKTGKLSK